ncbi:T9SS type A sorting domain-containing protein, partial [candidate division WOR-3 bacterium]|nr:T9SS type A sorting domain-containing protein [candidate division WOR-3 bacterium]
TGIEEMRDIPDRFVLFAPRPNPSVGMVELKYGLPERADIGLSIYDIQGRLVDMVYRGKRDAGYHKLKIDSRELSSGIYFIRFQTPCSTHIEKLIILR